MITQLDSEGIEGIANPAFREYARIYESISQSYRQSVVERWGLPFEERESQPRRVRSEMARMPDVHCENDNRSIWRRWISSACIACRKGVGTSTYYVSLQCTRSCYFCFNPNQNGYEEACRNRRDIAREFEESFAKGKRASHLAVTGGEPMLHKREALRFLETAKGLQPGVHTRLYTSGDLLDAQGAAELAAAGLDEIRFSVKLEDGPEVHKALFDLMGRCTQIIGDVVVEMPVMPDEGDRMKQLLDKLESLHIRGINCLELGFPFSNTKEFAARGYRIRHDPYDTLYDYWYAAGVPIAGSESVCLDLLRYASEKDMGLGVHYCTMDNKNSGQVYRQNASRAKMYPLRVLSGRDFFLKSMKAFGEDAVDARRVFEKQGASLFSYNRDYRFLEFHPQLVSLLVEDHPDMEIGVSFGIVEPDNGSFALRELRVDLTSPRLFDARTDL